MPELRSPWRTILPRARQHITAQGGVVYAANLLHDEFFNLFVVALSLERTNDFGSIGCAYPRFREHGLAIWHVVQSDKAQRDMAFEAISTVPTGIRLAPALKRIAWAKKRAEKLAEYRNTLAHTGVLFRGNAKGGRLEFVPQFGSHGARPSHAGRLKVIEGLAFWHSVRNDLLKLTLYVRDVTLRIVSLECARHGSEFGNAPKTWPKRPRLPSLAQIQAIETTINQAAQRTTQRTPRRPSRRKPPRADGP